MDSFLRSGEQRVDASGIVVGSLVLWASAGEVEAFSEAIRPVAAVGLAAEVDGHQIEELFNRDRWKTRIQLASAIRDYIELFHNTRRRHSTLGMLTPTEYEKLHSLTHPPHRLTPEPRLQEIGGRSASVKSRSGSGGCGHRL
jgi:hypothetical protein